MMPMDQAHHSVISIFFFSLKKPYFSWFFALIFFLFFTKILRGIFIELNTLQWFVKIRKMGILIFIINFGTFFNFTIFLFIWNRINDMIKPRYSSAVYVSQPFHTSIPRTWDRWFNFFNLSLHFLTMWQRWWNIQHISIYPTRSSINL